MDSVKLEIPDGRKIPLYCVVAANLPVRKNME